jgi:hypothetical protein
VSVRRWQLAVQDAEHPESTVAATMGSEEMDLDVKPFSVAELLSATSAEL